MTALAPQNNKTFSSTPEQKGASAISGPQSNLPTPQADLNAKPEPSAETDIISKTIAEALAAHHQRYNKPACVSPYSVEQMMQLVFGLLFPHFSAKLHIKITLEDDFARPSLEAHDAQSISTQLIQLQKALSCLFTGLMPDKAAENIDHIIKELIRQLPELAIACHEDAVNLYEHDPSTDNLDEVILSYPGFYAVAAYRFAHMLYAQHIPLLPRMITEYAHAKTGIDIHPAAQIGQKLYIDHGTGVVIGGTAIIGNNVKIYQGVTIGALRINSKDRHTKRHPTIEDGVVIYANATILGGDTCVGAHSVIGGNVWLTQSVPPHSRVMFQSAENTAPPSNHP